MKFATKEEHIMKEILVGARVQRATSIRRKNQVQKGMVCFGNNIAHSSQAKSALDPGSGVNLSHIR